MINSDFLYVLLSTKSSSFFNHTNYKVRFFSGKFCCTEKEFSLFLIIIINVKFIFKIIFNFKKVPFTLLRAFFFCKYDFKL